MAQREHLASRLGFLLLSAGCAIGLGNVWRFPYITGKYGVSAVPAFYGTANPHHGIFRGPCVPPQYVQGFFRTGTCGDQVALVRLVQPCRQLHPHDVLHHGFGLDASIFY